MHSKNIEESKSGMDSLPAEQGVIGILGGMGPLATVDFVGKIIASTPATSDQEHVPLLIASIPQIPDRTRAFRGEGSSPAPAMIASALRLKHAGAQLLVMACNTAHLWYEQVQEAVGLPMLHLVDAAVADAAAVMGPSRRVGLLGTDATLASCLYVNRETAAELRIRWMLPTARETSELVMPGIEAVKAGDMSQGERLLTLAARALQARGATALILGCTEIPLVLAAENASVAVIDATASLARRAVAWSLAERSKNREMIYRALDAKPA